MICMFAFNADIKSLKKATYISMNCNYQPLVLAISDKHIYVHSSLFVFVHPAWSSFLFFSTCTQRKSTTTGTVSLHIFPFSEMSPSVVAERVSGSYSCVSHWHNINTPSRHPFNVFQHFSISSFKSWLCSSTAFFLHQSPIPSSAWPSCL